MAAALQMIPTGAHIAFGGIGHQQLMANTIAISQGYGVRVGLEDNLWMDEQRIVPATNQKLVSRVHELLELLGKRHMPSAMFGRMGFYNPNR
jgi:uncharacterized protein (DUF849 family)